MNKNQASLSVSAVLSKPFKILLLLMCFSIPLSSGAVELNGYYFGSDSADIWENKYFTQYDPSGPTPLFLYGSRLLGGYGGFGFWLAQFFDETDTYTFVDDAGIERTINCVVRREHGYWPDYIAHQIGGGYKLDEDHAAGSTSVTLAQGIEPVAWEHGICRVNGAFYEYGSRTNTSFDDLYTPLSTICYAASTGVDHVIPARWQGKKYTRYDYLAKDVNNNIHILKSIRPSESPSDLDDKQIIQEGGTTLMYPNNPFEYMPVYLSGIVIDSDADGVVTPGGNTYDI